MKKLLLAAALVAFSSMSYAGEQCKFGWPVLFYKTDFHPYFHDSQFGRPYSYYRYGNCLVPRGFYPGRAYPTWHSGKKYHHPGFCRYINKEGLSIEVYCQK